MIRPRAAVVALGLIVSWLGGCAPVRLEPAVSFRPPPRPSAPLSQPRPTYLPSLTALPGWADEDHLDALHAYQAGCGAARDPPSLAGCAEARRLQGVTDAEAKAFFEAAFRPEVLSGPGLLTAYFAPQYPARTQPDSVFSAPLRPRPSDLVLIDPGPADPPGRRLARLAIDATLQPYPDRTEIELTPPVRALAWMRPEDLFFLQIQGSGGVVFPDGRRMKAVYDADNGHPFAPVAQAMVRRGLLAPDHASGEAIRAWLAAHRGAQAQAVMDLNPRYVFFSLVPDDGRDPVGAAGVPLPAGRAIAVDPVWSAYGQLYWIDAVSPVLAGAVRTYRRLVVALDTGSAIKGQVRADLYLGRGERAGLEAGRVRHTLLLVRLVPVAQGGGGGG